MNLFFWFATVLDGLDLEDQYHHRVRVVLAYAREVDDFDDFVDPRQLYACCLGPEPSRYVLEKIRWEEKRKILSVLNLFNFVAFLNFVVALANFVTFF